MDYRRMDQDAKPTEEVDVRDIAAIISRELCELTRRASQIAEQEMKDETLRKN